MDKNTSLCVYMLVFNDFRRTATFPAPFRWQPPVVAQWFLVFLFSFVAPANGGPSNGHQRAVCRRNYAIAVPTPYSYHYAGLAVMLNPG
jgi:hypothetical protein